MRVERSMAASRREEEFLVEMVLEEDSKEKRLERARLKTMTSKRKFEVVKWRRMLELLRGMELGDYNRETEELETMILEVMEVVEQEEATGEIIHNNIPEEMDTGDEKCEGERYSR